MSNWNLPPGCSPNDPHLTGEWPCVDCDGAGYDEDEDGKHSCRWCRGTGVEPEEPPFCRTCETDSSQVEYFFHNLKSDAWQCNLCYDDGPDPDWERV